MLLVCVIQATLSNYFNAASATIRDALVRANDGLKVANIACREAYGLVKDDQEMLVLDVPCKIALAAADYIALNHVHEHEIKSWKVTDDYAELRSIVEGWMKQFDENLNILLQYYECSKGTINEKNRTEKYQPSRRVQGRCESSGVRRRRCA